MISYTSLLLCLHSSFVLPLIERRDPNKPTNMLADVVLDVSGDATPLKHLRENASTSNIRIRWHGFLALVVTEQRIRVGEELTMKWTRPLLNGVDEDEENSSSRE